MRNAFEQEHCETPRGSIRRVHTRHGKPGMSWIILENLENLNFSLNVCVNVFYGGFCPVIFLSVQK